MSSVLDRIAERADADLPVTALTLYACTTVGCRHDALRGGTFSVNTLTGRVSSKREDLVRALKNATRDEIIGNNIRARDVRERLDTGRPLHLPARRCGKDIGGCGKPRLRLPRTAQPEPPDVGREAIRSYLTDNGIEPRGL